MVDNIIRDVDIVTSKYKTNDAITPIFFNDKLVQNIYFVGETDDDNYVGDGSYEKPFSKKQLLRLKKNNQFNPQLTDLILPIKLDKTLNEDEYNSLMSECTPEYSSQQNLYLESASQRFEIEKHFPDLQKTRSISKQIINKDSLISDITKAVELLCEDNYFDYGDFQENEYEILASSVKYALSDDSIERNTAELPRPDFSFLDDRVEEAVSNQSKKRTTPKRPPTLTKSPRRTQLTPNAQKIYSSFIGQKRDISEVVKIFKEIRQSPKEQLIDKKTQQLTPKGQKLFNSAMNIKKQDNIKKLIKQIKKGKDNELIDRNGQDLTPKGRSLYNAFFDTKQSTRNVKQSKIAAPVFD